MGSRADLVFLISTRVFLVFVPGPCLLQAAMPYADDGETWTEEYTVYDEGMAENKPGHKSFNEYKLPRWVKHPITHPFSGIMVVPKHYAFASFTSTLDGLTNHMAW